MISQGVLIQCDTPKCPRFGVHACLRKFRRGEAARLHSLPLRNCVFRVKGSLLTRRSTRVSRLLLRAARTCLKTFSPRLGRNPALAGPCKPLRRAQRREEPERIRYLGQEHTVAITEKPVSVPDCVRIRGARRLPAGKGAHQDEQTGLGQMEVC